MSEKTKEQRIKSAYNRIRRKYKELPKNELDLLTPLMKRTAYLETSLEDLEKLINEKGYSDEYKNGEKQSGTKGVPEVQAYLGFQKQYTANLKLLADRLPKEKPESKLQKFLDS